MADTSTWPIPGTSSKCWYDDAVRFSVDVYVPPYNTVSSCFILETLTILLFFYTMEISRYLYAQYFTILTTLFVVNSHRPNQVFH